MALHFASVKPLVKHTAVITGETPVNLALGAPNNAVRMGGAFSFMCALRMDGIGSWSRVFDFSLTADEDSITAGAVGLSGDLHFTIFRGKQPFSVRVGENEEGVAPLRQDRPRMLVGGHYLYTDQAFNGSLKDVKIWNQEVAWPTLEDAEAPMVPKAGGGFPGDFDSVFAPSGKGKDVPNTVFVEPLDDESTDAESLVSDDTGASVTLRVARARNN